MNANIVSVSLNQAHTFSKTIAPQITLLAGLGIEGDAHCGAMVKHRSRVRQDPTQPNLRQVHLLHRELFDELAAKGYTVSPGDLGENITTSGIALLELPTGPSCAFTNQRSSGSPACATPARKSIISSPGSCRRSWVARMKVLWYARRA